MAKSDNKVDIKKKVTAAVSGLKAPTRSETATKLVFTANWSYPDAAFNKKKDDRFQGVLVEWTIDTNSVKTSVKKGKIESLSGTKKTKKVYKPYSGSNKKSSTLELNRSDFYPFVNARTLYVQLFKVTKASYNNKTRKWKITKSAQAKLVPLTTVNSEEKKGAVYSKASLTGFAKSKSPVGKTFYKSKSATSKYTKYAASKKPIVYGVGVRVQGWNKMSPTKAKKKAKKSSIVWDNSVPTQAAYFSFSGTNRPKTPTVTIGTGAQNHAVTYTITDDQDNGTNHQERYQTRTTLEVAVGYYDHGGPWRTTNGYRVVKDRYGNPHSCVPNTAETHSVSRIPNDDFSPLSGRTIQSLLPNEYVKYKLTADSQGIRGDSPDKDVCKEILIARPHDVTINNVVKEGNFFRIQFTASVPTGGYARLTSRYTLQRLANYRPERGGRDVPVDDWIDSEWLDAASKETSAWTDVKVLGHDSFHMTQFFTDLVVDAEPQAFRRTYYRVVPSNDIDGLDGVPSKPFVAPGFLAIPSAMSQESKILSCSSAENGNSIMAVVAFKKTKTTDGYLNSNGTEMTWDTFEYAWNSSSLPSSYDFKDDVVQPIKVTQELKEDASTKKYLADVTLGWLYATYYLRGVQASQKYYVKARRFLKDTETREADSYADTYAEYSTPEGALATIEVKATPKEVKISAPERLVEGKDLSVSWTYDSSDTQKQYQVFWLQGDTEAAKSEVHELISKEDSTPYAVIPWSDVEKGLVGEEGRKDHFFVAVRMCVEDGVWSELSDVKGMKIVRPPRASLGELPTLVRQPLIATFGTDDPSCSIVTRIVARQMSGWGPMGADNVAEGSIAYSTKINIPKWEETTLLDGTKWYYYNYEFPIISLKDGATYTLEYTAHNDELDLSSDTVDEEGNIVKQASTFSVAYEEVAEYPNFYIVADPVTEEHDGKAHITIMDTPSANKDCVADIYRVNATGPVLLLEGLTEWRNVTVVDKFPTYSRHDPCVYRVSLRTPNGVCSWDDRSYSMPGYCVRFDWGDPEAEKHGEYNHLTLPFNLKWSDSWTKNSRVELHLDGEYSGFWRDGTDHKNSLSTEIVKLDGREQVERVMALARHSGPVLVRLPNGCSFCADVQVSNLDVSYDSLTVSASFSAQEMRMPSKFLDGATSVEPGRYIPTL